MNMTEMARLIEGLREDGWSGDKISDFLLYIESGDKRFSPKNRKDNEGKEE